MTDNIKLNETQKERHERIKIENEMVKESHKLFFLSEVEKLTKDLYYEKSLSKCKELA